MTFGQITFGPMTFGLTKFGLMTFGLMSFGLMTYRNDISIKSSNVKLNINDVCNLIRMLKARSTRVF
jgi:hypothetical protein